MRAAMGLERGGHDRTGARVAVAGCSAFLLLLFAVHLLRTDLDPSWHFISEYEIGRFGFMMQLAFIGFAVAHFGLARSLASSLRGRLGRLGLLLLLIAGLGLLLGGLFRADAMLTPAGAGTTSGMIHNIGGGLGIAMPFAAILVTVLLRRLPAWGHQRRIVVPLAALAVASSAVTIIVFAAYLSASGGVVEAGMPLGIFNRLEILAYAIWFLAVARGAGVANPSLG